jgi:hypothetical protein
VSYCALLNHVRESIGKNAQANKNKECFFFGMTMRAHLTIATRNKIAELD